MRDIMVACLLLTAVAAGVSAEEYGAPLELEASTPLADLLADPDAYLDQPVRVEGSVHDVSPTGNWIDIVDGESGDLIRFKVLGDDIVFPPEAKGRAVVAEGVLSEIHMDEPTSRRWLAQVAKAQGKRFKPSSVKGPMTFHRLEGRGASIR